MKISSVIPSWFILTGYCVLHLLSITRGGNEEIPPNISIPGDIIVGGLFPVHERGDNSENDCGVMNGQPGLQYMEAMLFALDEINNNPEILANITLGTTIYDTCRSQTIASARAKEFIKHTLFKNKGEAPLAGVIGPFSSGISKAVASFFHVFEIPQISYASTSYDLSNKQWYGYFFRTVPPNTFQAKTHVSVIRNFGWNYVLTVNSYGNYGEKGVEKFKEIAEKEGICIAGSRSVPLFSEDKDFDQIIEFFLNIKNANIIVVFTTMVDSERLLKAASRNEAAGGRFSWIGDIGWSNRESVTSGQEETAQGAITINHMDGRVQAFENYFLKLHPDTNHRNIWFEEYWQDIFKCKLKNVSVPWYMNSSRLLPCNGGNLKSINLTWSPVRVVLNAVYAMAYALDDLQKSLCGNASGMCENMTHFSRKDLLSNLTHVSFPDSVFNFTFKFNQQQEVDGNYTLLNFKVVNGLYKYEKIGTWQGTFTKDGTAVGNLTLNSSLVQWKNDSVVTPLSVCSLPCELTKITEPSTSLPARCCWDCISCATNQIIKNNTCVDCTRGYVPEESRRWCKKLPLRYSRWDTIGSTILLTLASIGVICTLFVFCIFIRFNEHQVIKASGRELCYMILISFILSYSLVFVHLSEPTKIKCFIKRYGTVPLVAHFAPLFMKTNRIYRIFKAAGRQVTRPPLTSPVSQVLITSAIIAVQVLLGTLWVLSDKPRVQELYDHKDYIELVCASNTLSVVINLSYSAFLVFLCTFFAFKTRKCPEQFNEAKYIGFIMYFTCSVWVIYIPTFTNTKDCISRDYLVAGASILVTTFSLCFLFFPKIRLVCSSVELYPSSSINRKTNNKCISKVEDTSSKESNDVHESTSYQKEIPDVHSNRISDIMLHSIK